MNATASAAMLIVVAHSRDPKLSPSRSRASASEVVNSVAAMAR